MAPNVCHSGNIHHVIFLVPRCHDIKDEFFLTACVIRCHCGRNSAFRITSRKALNSKIRPDWLHSDGWQNISIAISIYIYIYLDTNKSIYLNKYIYICKNKNNK